MGIGNPLITSLLGGVDPAELMETLARFIKETNVQLDYIHHKLDVIEAKLNAHERCSI